MVCTLKLAPMPLALSPVRTNRSDAKSASREGGNCEERIVEKFEYTRKWFLRRSHMINQTGFFRNLRDGTKAVPRISPFLVAIGDSRPTAACFQPAQWARNWAFTGSAEEPLFA